MQIRCPNENAWEIFHSLVQAEGWRIPQSERMLFRTEWADSAKVLVASGRFCGLVTAVAHERSGWIGNLVVPIELRGQGYGSYLFRWAMQELLNNDVTSIWLTASEQGRPIYEQEGFAVVDQIERWQLKPGFGKSADFAPGGKAIDLLADFDQRIWGERRHLLLETIQQGNRFFSCHDSVALLQRDDEMQIIGPWYSDEHCPRSNRILLQQMIDAAHPSLEIVVDLMASSPVRPLLPAAGFQLAGETALMVYGDTSQVDLKKQVALASLGSVG